MIHSAKRRALLLTAATLPLTFAVGARAAASMSASSTSTSAETLLAELERSSGGRLGVSALNTASGERIGYRAEERFPFCSTFKLILSAAILARSTQDSGLMQRRIRYAASDLVSSSPLTTKHLAEGMTVGELCAATLQISDNTAANLLIKVLGGPAEVTAYARSIGNESFHLDRTETTLNTAIPGDTRDTATPASMALSVQGLVLGESLPQAQRTQLIAWLRANRLGDQRIRAGVPADWQVADKTGTGEHGTANDIGVLWRPTGAPIVLALYYTQGSEDEKVHSGVLAAAARIVASAFG
ncbi:MULTISPECIES: class A beta-lactamase [Paraburkholderia]|uniref:class A beta-lactamase n=1 Tax=Paraburkholderia TaxID=1822464 RepID=UPI002257CB52|nr:MULTISPECIES: class A beta-lactamase [Paraburkholderia]MCX4164515.1 class A beta-lactamase [Paraburkholderia megapolitana]MDN7160008.1 class A beta-lactamase [Paraburkholderia sp. CHISQ3]MDQ6497055.1 class A beta-lactamase [Paraburkholderia megapolitana]